MERIHGGDWAAYRARYGRDPLDFSQNISPLGLPAGVAAAIRAAVEDGAAARYPDPGCTGPAPGAGGALGPGGRSDPVRQRRVRADLPLCPGRAPRPGAGGRAHLRRV